MTERPVWAATDKQRAFILALLEKQVVPELEDTLLRQLVTLEDFTKLDATAQIQTLLAYPKKTQGPTTTTAPVLVRKSPLDDLVDTRFAIPMTELSPATACLGGNGSLWFGEMKTFKGFRYMNVLHGAHPTFARTKIQNRSVAQTEIADLLRKDLVGYVRHYSDGHEICSSCGADLSDDRSRELKLGPECRKKFGL